MRRTAESPLRPQPAPERADDERSAEDRLALEAALRYLNKRERSHAEVRRHLTRGGFGREPVARALSSLTDQGALDDRRFARLFAQDKRELEQWGNERIRRALLERGIEADTVAAALAEGDGTDGSCMSERDRALELLRRRFPSPPRERRERDRALGVLLRKGYEFELALEAITALARAETPLE